MHISCHTISSTVRLVFSEFLMFCWLISWAFCLVKWKWDMGSGRDIGRIVRDNRAIGSLPPAWKKSAFCRLNEYISIFPLLKSNVVFFVFFLFSQEVQVLNTEHKYDHFYTPLTQSDSKYFFMLAINCNTRSREYSSTYHDFFTLQYPNQYVMDTILTMFALGLPVYDTWRHEFY